jgi:hypothetical protein
MGGEQQYRNTAISIPNQQNTNTTISIPKAKNTTIPIPKTTTIQSVALSFPMQLHQHAWVLTLPAA